MRLRDELVAFARWYSQQRMWDKEISHKEKVDLYLTGRDEIDPEETTGENMLITVNGGRFWCDCGSTLFQPLKHYGGKYMCNSCGAIYSGDK